MKVSRLFTTVALALSVSTGSPTWAADTVPAVSTPTTAAPAAAQLCDAQQELDRMDGRVAVPLLPRMAAHQKQNMRDHLVVVQEIVVAISTGDFSAIASASQRIGLSDRMAQMCTHMGAGAPGFTDQALNFHRTADTITAAATQKDMAAVTKALGATLQTCTSCHAAFRQHVVDEATWSRITSMRPPGGHGPMGMGARRGPDGRRGRGRCADPASPDCPARGPGAAGSQP